MSTPSDRHHSATSRLPDRLRGILLPEISRPADLAGHTGLPEEWFVEELETGRLPGLKLVDEWLVHRRAVQVWLGALESGDEEVSE